MAKPPKLAVPKENKEVSNQKRAAQEHRTNRDKSRTGSIFESFVKKDGVEEYIERRRFGGNLDESDESEDDNISSDP